MNEACNLDLQTQSAANHPLGIGPVADKFEAAQRIRYQTQQRLMVLREAHRIRQDPEAMALIREMIRQEREELATILDQ